MRDIPLKVLAVASTVGGTAAGLVLRAMVDISSDTGALVGFFSIVATPIGIVIGLLLFLVLSQHAGTREKLEEFYAITMILPDKGGWVKNDNSLRRSLSNLGEAFYGRRREAELGFEEAFRYAPTELRLELVDRWRKLVAIATTRLPTALWIALFSTNFFSSLLVAMVQFTPITTVVVLIGWNVLFGGLAVLIADFDDPFDGWFNITNPFST
ncbi:MAG: hypothetical protein AAB486_00900 [Patescibacteria group bacterium]